MDSIFQRTADLLKRQLQANPEDIDLKLQLAEVLAQLGNAGELKMLLDDQVSGRLIENAEQLNSLLRGVAQTDFKGCLDILDTLISMDKSCALLYFRKSELLVKLGDTDGAAKFRNVAFVIDESLESSPPTALLANDDNRHEVNTPLAAVPIQPAESFPSDEHVDSVEEDSIESVDALLASLESGYQPTSFKDVGGMQDLKNQIRMKILLPFEKPEIFKKFKKKAGGGVLFYGPPGCGKTLLARAAAGEANLFFNSLGIPEVLSKWLGESEQRIQQFFTTARRKAPSLLFIDEIDALGAKRSEATASMSTLVNVLLTEIDGATSNNENVFVLAATNMPWRVDSAFRRPGRFDQVIFVPPPDQEARKAILDIYLEGLPTQKVDTNKIAKITPKFSGADLESLVSGAAEDALMAEMNSGKSQFITTDLLVKKAKKQRPTTLEWLEQATNYASFANSSGLYDDLARYLETI